MFRLFVATTSLPLLLLLIFQTPVQNSNSQLQQEKSGSFRKVPEGNSLKIRRSVIDSSDTVENSDLRDAQYFTETPISRTVLEGAKVVFSCVVANRKGQFRWYRNDHVILSATGNSKYQLLADHQKGNFSLAINNVEKADEGWFHCHVEGSSPNSRDELQSENANLFVEVMPTRPRILENSGGVVIGKEGQLLKLTCQTIYCQPVPRLRWLNNEKVLVTKGVTSMRTTQTAHGVSGPRLEKILFSFLSFQATRQNTSKNIFCTVTLSRIQKDLSRKSKLLSVVKLNVTFGPKVRISLRGASQNSTDSSSIPFSSPGSSNFFWEFEIVEILCSSEGNPRVAFRWFVDNQPIELRMIAMSQMWSKKISYIGNLDTSKVTLYRVGRRLHGSFVECQGENSVGHSDDVVGLEIKFGPRFTRTENSTDEEEGVAELICEAEGNPEPAIFWYHTDLLGSPPQIVSCLSSVKIRIAKDTVGLYECFAVAPGFRNISTKMWIADRRKAIDVTEPELTEASQSHSFTAVNLCVIVTIVIGVFILLVVIVAVLIAIRCRRSRFGRIQDTPCEDDAPAVQFPAQNQSDDDAEPSVEDHIYEAIAEDDDGVEKYCSKCGEHLGATGVQTQTQTN